MEKSNRAEINLTSESTSDEMETSSNNNSKNIASSDEKPKTIDDHWKCIVFGKDKNLSLEVTESREQNESDEKINNAKNNSNKIGSAGTIESADADKSEEDDNADGNNRQLNNVKHRRVSRSKRKLSSQGTDDEELADPGKKLTKRSRGKYLLRNLSKSSSSGYNGEDQNPDTSEGNDDNDEMLEDSNVQIKMGPKRKKIQRNDHLAAKRRSEHHNKILKIINEGSPAALRSLARIGPKTAVMLHDNIQLNGKLKSIRDLENMSGWTPKFFQQFLSSNNIRLD